MAEFIKMGAFLVNLDKVTHIEHDAPRGRGAGDIYVHFERGTKICVEGNFTELYEVMDMTPPKRSQRKRNR